MTNIKLASVLALLPRSDEQLANAIGISSKTIKRIKKGNYDPGIITTDRIVSFLDKLCIELLKYMKNGDYEKPYFEMEDYPRSYFIARDTGFKNLLE